MNQFVIIVLIIYGLAWLYYVVGLRDNRFAFALWFPLTATSFFGTLIWIVAALGLLASSGSGGAAGGGFIGMGMAMALGFLIGCPIIFAISLWQRPTAEAYSFIKVLPVLVFYFGLLLIYRPIAQNIGNQKLRLVVLDTKKNPIAHAKVAYETTNRFNGFSFPSPSLSGVIETGADGLASLPVPKTHEINCKVSMDGYANLRIHMDRAWGTYAWRQTNVDWQFPPDDPKKLWETHGGSVGPDVDSSNLMQLTVYLPKTRAEVIPNYGPTRICHEEQGKQIWTSTPTTILTH